MWKLGIGVEHINLDNTLLLQVQKWGNAVQEVVEVTSRLSYWT